MDRRIRTALVAATLALVSGTALPLSAQPQAEAAALDPARDEALAYAIGVQAYIQSFPLMDLYRTLWETSFDPERGHDRTLNEFFEFDRLITSADDWVITPNEDTIYSRAFFDLRREPVILVVPPSGGRQYWIPISDMHHDFDAVLAWDSLGARGGAFALVAPGWQGVLPEGVKRIEMGTPIGWMLPRFAVDGAADIPAARAFQTRLRLVPLSHWGKSALPRPRPDPAEFPRFTRAEMTNARAYFTTLNQALRLSPRLGNGRDQALEGWLRELAMDPASRFEWERLSPAAQRGLTRAAIDANRIIAQRMPRVMPTHNNWQIVRLPRRMSDEPVIAASGAMLGLLWNPLEINSYDLTFFDGKGAPLDGRNRYVLRYAPPPPVNGFWSVTMYSAETQLFVPNRLNRYSVGDRTKGTVHGPDGSIEIIIQHQEPTDPKERANWLPAPAGPFYLLARHYSPKPQIVAGDWMPPPIERR
ncbi:MAG: DUF1254 domain-containing protein [Sphingomonadaceae bacterium]